jgi:long-chain acyl-CoA synthetase
MPLAHLLLRHALEHPQRAAIYNGTQLQATYRDWACRSAGLAQRLRDAGLVPGDRVLLFMRNHPRYLEVMWGAWWAGLVVVPVNAKLHPREAEWIVANAQARWGFVTGDVAPQALAGLERQVDVEAAAADDLLAPVADAAAVAVTARDAGDVAWLFYTSGTTGRPKGVMITQRNLMTMGLTYFVDVDAVTAQDAIVYAAPMSHGAGLYAIPHLMAGARHVVPVSGGVDPAELFALGWQVGPLSTFAAPTIVKRLVDYAESAGLGVEDAARAFKTIVYGGAPMYTADLQRALRVMGPRFVQIYGQGESPMVGTALSRQHLADRRHPRHLERLGSVGVAQTPVLLRVADEHGRELPVGAIGEVLLNGDSVMAGYWHDPEATAAAIRDGWLFTGDVGCVDGDGFLTLKDRSKDLIISGGSNIYPREVEEVLLTAPGVAEVAVVGAPDTEWGEGVVAFVVPRVGAEVTPAALDAHCLARMARFKRPKRYLLVDELPKNNYGKVLKTALRAQLADPPRSAGVFIDALRAAFAAHADPARAPAMQAYMKSTLPFLGIPAPLRRRLTAAVVAAHPAPDTATLARTMRELWRGARFREERYAAIELPRLGRLHPRLVHLALLPLVEAMIVEGAWWDLVDDLSGNLLARLLERHPRQMKPVLRRWARGDDRWLRRAALLCQRHLSPEAFDARLLYDTILPSIGNGRFADDFFIRKGIGWALRERSYTAPDEVIAFCREYAAQLSPLTRREALKAIERRPSTRSNGHG